MDTKPCTCRGENPRCFRCDGTGYEPEVPHGWVEHAPTPAGEAESNTLGLTCSVCGDRSSQSPEGLEWHVLMSHRFTPEALRVGPSTKGKRRVVEVYETPSMRDARTPLARKRPRKKVRKEPSAPKSDIAKPKRPRAPKRKHPKGERVFEPPQTQPTSAHTPTEGTSDWYAAYRERNLFGSHAEFDDMGDESKP